ncbi:MAG TPA: hypothetical protein VF103_18245 [Polyangiaceae bacterium]
MRRRLFHSRGSVVWRLLFGVALVFSSASVLAAPSAQDRERARGFMDLGDDKAAAGDLEGALKAYQAADGIMGVPTTGLEVGRALEKLGRLIEARDALVKVARFPREAGESPVFTTARDKASELANALGTRIPQLTLKITGIPSGSSVEVSIDGIPLRSELLGLPVRVNPGKVALRATASGFLPIESEVTFAERETKEVALAFQPDPNASAAPPARADAPEAKESAAQKGRSRTLMWTAFGVGVAGIATGTVTGSLSLSKTKTAQESCDGNQCPKAVEKDLDTARTLANVANVGFAVGVVGAGIGIWQLLSTSGDAPKKAAAPPRLRAEARVGVGSITVAGTF